MSDDIGAMFYHGERPWHGLGRELPRPATLEEALRHGELDTTVELLPLATDEAQPDAVPQRFAVARRDRRPGDPGRILGVVHPGFVPLQNRTGAELFHRLLDLGDARYHTGGYLRDGEVVWLLARLPGEIVVTPDDRVETYVLYSNSHDGTRAIDIRLTTVRVVCRNTLSLALSSEQLHRPFRRAHRHPARVLEIDAKRFFAQVRRRIEETQSLLRRLQAASCDDEAFARFLRVLLPDPAMPGGAAPESPPTKAWRTRVENLRVDRQTIARIRRVGVPDADVPPDPATWWGSVNAVSAWTDHVQRIGGHRYAHALFGAGDRLKRRAIELAVVQAGP